MDEAAREAGPDPGKRIGAGEIPEAGFRARRWVRRAGWAVGEPALILYYTLHEPDLPAWARSVIYGALGYFLTPWDTAPDFIAGVGYSDDLDVLTAALATVAVHVTPATRSRARERLETWLGYSSRE